MKNTIRRFITTALAASMLTLTANAYTIPEYSFDYSVYHENCESCDFCSDTLKVLDADDERICPDAILLVLKCEYTYYNSVWTVEDFPELEATGVEIECVRNSENFYEKTDEEIQEYLDWITENVGTYHTGISVRIAEEDATVENARKVRDAIVEACENGEHPEIWSVEFNVFWDSCDSTGMFGLADVNGDSVIDSIDATIVVRHVVGVDLLDSVKQEWVDVNTDGIVDAIDATLITRYAVGLIDKYGNQIA